MKVKFPTFSIKRTALILFLLALFIRFAVALISNQNKVWDNFADDRGRVVFAQSILKNGFIPEISNFFASETIFAPLVPIVIALKIMIFGNTWLPLFILNSIISALSCLLIYYIASKFFNQTVSLIAFAWAAVYPNYIRYVGTGGNEPWVVLLFASTFLFAVKVIESEKIDLKILLFALFFTLLFHTDERYISYALPFTLFLFLGSSSRILKLKKAGVFILLTIILSTPWLIRNYYVYDDIVLVTVRTTNLTTKVFNHRPELVAFDHEPSHNKLNYAQIDSIQMGLLTTLSNNKPIRKDQIEAIKKGNIPHAFDSFEKYISRFHFLWMPFKLTDNYRIDGYVFVAAWSLQHNLLTGLSYGLLLPFVILGLIRLAKEKRWLPLILFSSIMFYHTFIHVAFIPYTRDRYRHPIDFIIILLGAYGIFIAYNFLKTKNYLPGFLIKNKDNNKLT